MCRPAPHHPAALRPRRMSVLLTAAMAGLLGATTTSLSLPAQAHDEEEVYGLSGSLGLGAVNLPTYEGSARRRTVVGPDFTLSYRSREWGSVELGPRGLLWQALQVGDFSVGLVAGVDPGRKARDTRATDPTPGDKHLAGMGDVRASAELGLALGYGPLSLQTRQSLGRRSHRGTQVDVGLNWPWAVSERLGLHASAHATWADARSQQAYFGVTAVQASATGWRVYAPRAGLRKAELSLGAQYALRPDTLLRGSAAASRLVGDSGRSPLVQRKTGTSVALALVFAF